MVKMKVIRDVIEEIELANDPYLLTGEEEQRSQEMWNKTEKVVLWRGVDNYGGKWFRVHKYDLAANPPKRFVLDSSCGWREYKTDDFFPSTVLFREEE